MAIHSNTLAWKIPWMATVHGVAMSRTRLSDFTFLFFLSKLKVVFYFSPQVTSPKREKQVFLYPWDRTEGTPYPLDLWWPGPASHLRENWRGIREEPLTLEQKTAGPHQSLSQSQNGVGSSAKETPATLSRAELSRSLSEQQGSLHQMGTRL